MNIAITSQDKKRVTGRAGKCQYFWVYEIVSGEVHNKHCLYVPKAEIFDHCDFIHKGHSLDGVSVLITHSMGEKLQRRLKKIGIMGLVTKERDPDEVIHHFLNGSLVVRDVGRSKRAHSHKLLKQKGFASPMASTRAIGTIL